MSRRRRPKSRILLPGEKESRRGFLKAGLIIAAIAAVGAFYLSGRTTRRAPDVEAEARTLSPDEISVLLTLAGHVVPGGAPGGSEADLARRLDHAAASLDPGARRDLKRLVWVFESALAGALDGIAETFTDSPAADQDRRIAAWAESRIPFRRRGIRILREFLAAASGMPTGAAATTAIPARADEVAAPPQPTPGAEDPPTPPQASRTLGIAPPLADELTRTRRRPAARAERTGEERARPRPSLRSAPLRPKPVELDAVDHAGLEPRVGGETARE